MSDQVNTPNSQLDSSVDKAQQLLSSEQIKSLEILAFFFYQIGQFDSAQRAVQALLVLAPQNDFATHMQVLCADSLEHFEEVVSLTDKLMAKEQDSLKLRPDLHQALLLLRSRALHKLKRFAESQATLSQIE